MYVVIKVKGKYSHNNIPEMVGIYYNPYNWSVQDVINFWIEPEFIRQVYGYKIK